MDYVFPLIGEAWDRRRRRHRRLAAMALMGTATVFAFYVLRPLHPGSNVGNGNHWPASAQTVAPDRLFSQAPYMGVRCPVANSIACDRVGLAIWLKRPAYSVRATIAGAPLWMDRFGDRLVSFRTTRREFDGYLQPAGIVSELHVRPDPGSSIWLGDATPFPSVWLLIDYGRGDYVVTHLRVPLSAGWG